MQEIGDIVANYESSSPGFPEGKLRDNPGDDSGSGIMAALDNDIWYAITAAINKFRTSGKGGAAESTTNSDFVDAIEEMVGQKVDGVSEYSDTTTYSTPGTLVMWHGVQFSYVSLASNTNKDPFLYPLLWMPVPDFKDLLYASMTGKVFMGESSRMHQYGNSNYLASFSLGTHRPGGASGDAFSVIGIHLDGATYGAGSAGYTALAGWAHKEIFSTFSTSYTMTDARARVLRAMSASGGLAPTIGALIEDQMQGHWHTDLYGNTTKREGSTNAAVGTGAYAFTSSEAENITIHDAITDGTNGTPRTGTETRVKSLTVGVPYIVIVSKA